MLIGAMSKPDDDEDFGADHPFTSQSMHKDISLSVFNTPVKLAQTKERVPLTQDMLLKNV